MHNNTFIDWFQNRVICEEHKGVSEIVKWLAFVLVMMLKNIRVAMLMASHFALRVKIRNLSVLRVKIKNLSAE